MAIAALLGFLFYADPIQMLQALLGITTFLWGLCVLFSGYLAILTFVKRNKEHGY
jgi:hypothetical protein